MALPMINNEKYVSPLVREAVGLYRLGFQCLQVGNKETAYKMTTIAIHQPGYMPWIGYFHKMMSCDTFVFLDDVQYERRGWQNRNKIKTSQGSSWLSVPVMSSVDDLINQIRIDNTKSWMRQHTKKIKTNYSRSDFFKEYWPYFEPIYEKKFDLLIDVDMEIIKTFMKLLKINTKTIFSSKLKITTKSSDRILDICKHFDADTYVSGALGTNYLNLNDFEKHGISVKFQHVQHPVYKQHFEPFMPNMSTLDLLFNEGADSLRIIRDMQILWNSA